MDHLQIPRDPVHDSIEVPLYCTEYYDKGPFLQYLDRVGWTREEITNTSTTHRTPDEIHAILQNWCYFGIINETFGYLDVEDFIAPSAHGSRRISTAKLPGIVSSWFKNRSAIPLDQRLREGRHILKCFSSIDSLVKDIHLTPPYFETRLDGRLLLSVTILLEALNKVATDGIWDFLDKKEREHLSVCNGQFLRSRMKQDGWCLNEITILGATLDTSLLYFISNLDPPRPEKPHSAFKCNTYACKAYNIDEATYQTKHTNDSCKCPFVFANQDDVYNILKKGSIPLAAPSKFAIKDKESENRSFMKLASLEPGVKYVAISHVWSNGLGNQHDNAIPQCQFNRISALVSNLYEGSPMPFWLDTLSFPLAPPEAYDLALIRMRDLPKGRQSTCLG